MQGFTCGLLSDFQGNLSLGFLRILCKQCLCKLCRRKQAISRTLVDVDDEYSNLLLRVLGQRIRELRTEQGYSQEAFADKCGVHRTFMGTVERGESNLSFHNIARVAKTLGVTLSKLFESIETRTDILAKGGASGAPLRKFKSGSRKP
jgi:DNA-binding XRE family transcriptional regulator